MPSYFNYSPGFLLDMGKVSLLRSAYLWLHLFFRTSEGAGGGEREKGEREERVEWNIKDFLKNCIVRIKETALSFILMFLNKLWKMSVDTSTVNHCQGL